MAIEHGYCTLDELKARLLPYTQDTDDDAILEQVINGVSREIDDLCGRRFYALSETRYYTPRSADSLAIDELLSVSTLKTDPDADRVYETTWSASDYDLEPFNAPLLATPQPYSRISIAPRGRYRFPLHARSVELAGSFGYAAAAPAPVREACLLQSARLFKRKDAIFGVIGSAEMGQLLTISKLDPDVKLLLDKYKRAGFA